MSEQSHYWGTSFLHARSGPEATPTEPHPYYLQTAKEPAFLLDSAAVDDLLVQSAKAGDTAAFAQLIGRHNRFCLAKAYSILRNYGDAEDEVQVSWMKVWTKLDTYLGPRSFSAWLGRIVSNQCLMRLRKLRLASLTSIDEVFDSISSYRLEVIDQEALPEEFVGKGQVSQVLEKEIGSIPPRMREVLVMRDVNRVGMTEIAAHLGITIPAAKSRLMRARLELRERLLKHCTAFGTGSLFHRPNRRRAAYVRAT